MGDKWDSAVDNCGENYNPDEGNIPCLVAFPAFVYEYEKNGETSYTVINPASAPIVEEIYSEEAIIPDEKDNLELEIKVKASQKGKTNRNTCYTIDLDKPFIYKENEEAERRKITQIIFEKHCDEARYPFSAEGETILNKLKAEDTIKIKAKVKEPSEIVGDTNYFTSVEKIADDNYSLQFDYNCE
jgi:hypothetical protein